MAEFQPISVRDLDYYIEQGNCRIIDLREPGEYRKGHIKNAVNLPGSQCRPGHPMLEYPLLILYCERGVTSMIKARELSEAGYQVKTVVGGIREYRGHFLVHS